MSKTKIKAALAALDKAAKAAFKVLNEATDGAFESSPAEAEPMRFAYEISQRLHKQLDHLEAHAKYDGMRVEEIAAQQATEAAEARAKLQVLAAEKLKGLKAQGEGVTEPDEPEADELDENPDDEDRFTGQDDSGNTDDEDPDGKQEPV